MVETKRETKCGKLTLLVLLPGKLITFDNVTSYFKYIFYLQHPIYAGGRILLNFLNFYASHTMINKFLFLCLLKAYLDAFKC